MNASGGVTLKGNAPPKLTTEEGRAVDAINSMKELGPQLLGLLEKANPGLGANPEQFSSPLRDMLGAKVGGALYGIGHVNSADEDYADQLTGYLEAVVPRILSSGRLNKEQYLDLKKHAPQLGLSAAANFLRTKHILENIMPAVEHGIQTTHRVGGVSSDPYANPDYQPR